MSRSAPLSAEQVADYRERGYLLIRGLFGGDEVARWQRDCDRLLALGAATDRYDMRVGRRVVADGRALVERFDPVQDVSPVFHALARDQDLCAALGQLLGDTPLLFKDKLIFKLPGMTGYTIHQDGAWWAGFPIERILTAMVAIDGAGADNGGLELFSGYHHALLSTPGELRNMNADEAAQVREAEGTLQETEPGDVLIFTARTPHRSGTNTGSRSRRQLYLTYSAARHGDRYAAHYRHYHDYSLAAKDPAERARYYHPLIGRC